MNLHSFYNWLIFSMFSGLGHENRLFRSFVFKKFSGLGACKAVGHKVARRSVGGEARIIRITNPFCSTRGATKRRIPRHDWTGVTSRT